MNRISYLLIAAVIPFTSSCALLNPYVSTSKAERNAEGKSAKELSLELRGALEANARGLAYWQSGSTISIAGLLGLGGYKGITSGGSHQVAALAAGGAAVYGVNSALYNPSREERYLAAASALVCLDKVYAPFNWQYGQSLMQKMTATKRQEVEPRASTALGVAYRYETSYRQNIIGIITQLNQQLAAQQPTADATFLRLSSAIQTPPTVAPPRQTEADKSTLCNEECTMASAELSLWIATVISAHRDFDETSLTTCSVGEDSLAIAGTSEVGEKIKVGQKLEFPILNTTGRLAAFVKPQDTADQSAISASITTSNGAYSLSVEGKTPSKKPIFVYVIDHGKGKATTGARFEVTQ